MKDKDRVDRIFRVFIYVLPAVLYFSYFPVIWFGANETMNFELSLPLLWLVLFDLFSLVILIKRRLMGGLLKKWMWLLFPVFVTLSIIWSDNVVRGVLTTGILWLIYFAVFAFLQLKKRMFKDKHKKVFLKWFFGSSLLICAWCWLQCILDIVGLPRECTFLCAGCTYKMFGFPHPNGFAIEPQFMGNLLLAPVIVAGVNFCFTVFRNSTWPKHYALLFFILMATLFLTFSRGAIYAFVMAMIFMSVFVIVRERKKCGEMLKRIGLMWVMVIFSFAFTLNMQGVFAQLSKTDDNYVSGVAKVLNHLSLGVVDIRMDNENALDDDVDAQDNDESLGEWTNNKSDGKNNDSVFDGYVAESTDTRVRLTEAAVTIWHKDFKNTVIGVGVGGAGQALYDSNLSPAPKEIIQNEYANLLVELGVMGILLFVLTIILIIRFVIKNSNAGLILTLIVAYGITLCFFSGLPNALHIYLLPVVLMAFCNNKSWAF